MYSFKRGAKKGRYSGGISIYYKNCFKDQIKVLEKNQSGILKQYYAVLYAAVQYSIGLYEISPMLMRYFVCYFSCFHCT